MFEPIKRILFYPRLPALKECLSSRMYRFMGFQQRQQRSNNNQNRSQPDKEKDNMMFFHVLQPQHSHNVALNKAVRPRLRAKPGETLEDIVVNVGGVEHRVLVSTLQRYPETLLGLIVTLPLEKVLERDLCDKYLTDKRQFYFDRSHVLFDWILNFYRSDSLHIPDHMCVESFLQELSYWRISPTHISSCCEHKVAHLDRIAHATTDSLETAADTHYNNADYTERISRQKFGNARLFLWILLEHPASCKLALGLMVISVLLIFATVIILVLSSLQLFQTVEVGQNGTNVTRIHKGLEVADTICVSWFSLEYIGRLIAAPDTWAYVRSAASIVDLLAILPFFLELIINLASEQSRNPFLGNLSRSFVIIRILRVLRIFRVLRVLKLARYSTGLKSMAETLRRSYRELSLLVMFITMTNILFSTVMYFLENEEPNTLFNNIPAASWWCIITMTTVGYGDMYPSTVGGKIVASLASIAGVILLAFPISIIVENFNQTYAEQRQKKSRQSVEELSFSHNGIDSLPFFPHLRKLKSVEQRPADMPISEISAIPSVNHTNTLSNATGNGYTLGDSHA